MRPRILPSSLFLIVLAIAFGARPCLGQFNGPATSNAGYDVSGSVRDSATSQSLNGIRVDLMSEGMTVQFTFTRDEGQFAFGGVRNGQYDIRVSGDGYDTSDQSIEVARSSVYGVNVDLRKTAGANAPAKGGTVSVHQLGMPPKARREFDKAMDLMGAKPDFRAAIAQFERAIQDYPDYYEAYAMEGAAYLALSDSTSAERVLRKSVEMSSSKYPAALYLLAGLLNASGRSPEAEGFARQCVAVDDSSWHGYFELAHALLQEGKLEEAETSALKVRDLQPNNPKIYLMLANIHGARHEYGAFMDDLNHYLTLDPTGPMADEVRKKRDQVQQALRDAQTAPPPPQSQPAQQVSPPQQ